MSKTNSEGTGQKSYHWTGGLVRELQIGVFLSWGSFKSGLNGKAALINRGLIGQA